MVKEVLEFEFSFNLKSQNATSSYVVKCWFCIFDKTTKMDIQLKEKLIAEIGKTNDNELLCVFDLESKTDEFYNLSKEENEAVSEGIAQLENGKFLSNDEVNYQTDKCLNK